MLYVPLLDGRVARVFAADGSLRTPFELKARPFGDAASVSGHVAIAMEATVAIFAERETPTIVTLGADASAGVLASHGAFWVGDVRGGVTRIDTSGVTRVYSTGSKEPVVGLAAGRELVYALTSGGVLVAVDGAGIAPVRWRRSDIGDTVGRPAEAGGCVAVGDRAGHVTVFSAADGAPKGRRDAGAQARDGFRTVGRFVAAILTDGRVWFYDPATDAVVVNARLDGTARLPLAPVGDGSVVAPASGNGIVAFPAPK